MRKLAYIFDPEFRPHRLSYILQTLMATVAVFVALAVMRQQNLVIAASLAATAFTVFAMPGSVTASSRNVVGGHLIGLLFGSLFALIPQESGLMQDVIYALTLGFSMLAMAVTNTEHPPAAGTALGVVIAGFSTHIVLGVMIGVGILAIIHKLLRPLLRDLIAVSPARKLDSYDLHK